eukprot:6095095-Amphidinium_carterae.2
MRCFHVWTLHFTASWWEASRLQSCVTFESTQFEDFLKKWESKWGEGHSLLSNKLAMSKRCCQAQQTLTVILGADTGKPITSGNNKLMETQSQSAHCKSSEAPVAKSCGGPWPSTTLTSAQAMHQWKTRQDSALSSSNIHSKSE